MKILFVCEYFPPNVMGGGEINLHAMARHLAKDHEVHVLTRRHADNAESETIEGIKVIRRIRTGSNPESPISNIIRGLLMPYSVKKQVKRLAKKEGFDIIHFFGTTVIASGAFEAKRYATVESYPGLCPKGDRLYRGKIECPHKCSFFRFLRCQLASDEIGKMKNGIFLKYNPLALCISYLYYLGVGRGMRKCRLIAVSEYVSGLLDLHGMKSRILPNAINAKVEKAGGGGKTRILYLGSLNSFKGPQILVEALKGQDVRCDIYGRGPLRKKLQRLIEDIGADAMIHEPRPYEEVFELISCADIVVFPSIWPEPFGRIAVEAMACAKPVIGSDIGGIRETIREGAGILVPSGDIKALAGAIGLLAHDVKLRKSMGEKGKDEALKYTIEKISKKLLLYYQMEVF